MLITGATGNNGQELVRQLIALGQPIRALVRNPEEASGIKGPKVELAVGDFDRTETLDTPDIVTLGNKAARCWRSSRDACAKWAST